MLNNEDKLIQAFKELNHLNDSHDVRLIEGSNSLGEVTTIGVAFYKNNQFCYGASLAELALDLILQQREEKYI